MKRISAEEFESFTYLPENYERIFELIAGNIVEKVSSPYASSIAALISMYIGRDVLIQKLGFITGARGGYMVANDRYAPDVAYISKAKQPNLPYEGYIPNPPDLAVEVLSPSDKDREQQLRIKIVNYQYAGTVVWVVNPEAKTVEVYTPGQPVKIVGEDGVVDGGTFLPGLTIALKDIFSELETE